MNIFLAIVVVFVFQFTAIAQPKKQAVKNKLTTSIIGTTNADTLYFNIDNTIVLLPQNNAVKTNYYFTASNGEINKLTTNLYQLSNIKDSSVMITVFDVNNNKTIETKKFVVAKQVLPF